MNYIKLAQLLQEMEEHRKRYTEENAKDGNDYWRGRRDEAGYFRDKLQAIFDEETMSLPFVQTEPSEIIPWKITATGDDPNRYVTFSLNGGVVKENVYYIRRINYVR